MKIVIASDSFKEACSAKEACQAIEKGVRQVFSEAEVELVPMADGGEGTTEALVDASGGQYCSTKVKGPLGKEIEAQYGLLGDGKTAVIEMAAASGIQLIDRQDRNPLITSTFGTGQLIADCLDKGITKIILGIGGSATNDGGAGMAQALGYRLLDPVGEEIGLGGGSLDRLSEIDSSKVHPRLAECQIQVACDVTNPLCGEEGASAVFGPQKGADPEMVVRLDQNLRHFAKIIEETFDKKVDQIPGSGAAGGLGAGLLAFTNAHLQPGVEIVIETVKLREKMQNADYCFTGEGQIDFQTQYGKTPFGVMKTAKETAPQMKVIALAGSVGKGIEDLYTLGFDCVLSITPGASELSDLLRDTEANLVDTTAALCHLLN
ncbi:glycerate kinase [Facklamia sp. DSM 111018]|uniref:Glycerate kinase n=1 Tax=Facklamia lactis TaxID=2749967 RepID=A0ABS0LSQ5_9LACT|nr:glycerate kinase [Facklamia lactis]MBG9981360.1 glycerate kinase [Facklamia lactis]MBG9987164.1 glycerate kinase [Facklamia lactis]